jgi:hypothetical protein
MAAQSEVTRPAIAEIEPSTTAVYAEGLRAGLAGAATIALWFFVLDVLFRRAFYTPNLLGTALFRGGAGLDDPAALPISSELVLSFTWVHVLVFLVIGIAASKLLALAEREPHAGFGIVLFLVFFECGFLLACMALAEPLLHAMAWTEVLVGNLLAAAAMTIVFRRWHPRLAIQP